MKRVRWENWGWRAKAAAALYVHGWSMPMADRILGIPSGRGGYTANAVRAAGLPYRRPTGRKHPAKPEAPKFRTPTKRT